MVLIGCYLCIIIRKIDGDQNDQDMNYIEPYTAPFIQSWWASIFMPKARWISVNYQLLNPKNGKIQRSQRDVHGVVTITVENRLTFPV